MKTFESVRKDQLQNNFYTGIVHVVAFTNSRMVVVPALLVAAMADDYGTGSTAGPVFSSSRVITWSDLSDDEKDKFARFFAENNVSVSGSTLKIQRRQSVDAFPGTRYTSACATWTGPVIVLAGSSSLTPANACTVIKCRVYAVFQRH